MTISTDTLWYVLIHIICVLSILASPLTFVVLSIVLMLYDIYLLLEPIRERYVIRITLVTKPRDL